MSAIAFSQISRNWQGRPLDSTETMLKYMRTTSTSTGLKVRASMTRRNYPLGVKITDAEMADLEICWHDELPKWNYTLLPVSLPKTSQPTIGSQPGRRDDHDTRIGSSPRTRPKPNSRFETTVRRGTGATYAARE